ncbi:ABC transporter permease [Paenibacillus albiflavus]|uniref:ABC transporter permease n=1 Tax=Paenibacillus albiflavus TaxID=2545760 RepID=A0A4R4EBG9_9BACL|nr:ABC transporter permease [Paenibacillus albiflavus]TCZ77234.1 ABC transporter permease [Paenibacillus albiflavus]
MSNAQRALLVAAGLFLTIALITLVVNLFGSAQDASKQAQNEFSAIQTELAEQTFMVYDNTKLSGSQVLNAIRKFKDKDSFGVQVRTGKNKAAGIDGSWYHNYVIVTGNPDDPNYGKISASMPTGSLTNATSEIDNDYINPSGKFKSSLIRDKSNAIRAIVFVQET